MAVEVLGPFAYFVAVTGVAECIADTLDSPEAVAAGSLGRPDRILIAPGAEVPWDAGGRQGEYCSQLGIAFEHGPYPSTRFPAENVEDSGGTGNCVVDSTAVRCVVSLIRCQYHPQPTNQGKTPPTAGQQTAAALLQSVEEFFVRQAIYCCLAAKMNSQEIDDYRVGATDRQVNGDLGEIAIRFTMQIL